MSIVQDSRAIVLRWRSYGESDKIVTFLTEHFGKLTGIAKGAKRSRRRFVNSLEPLARVRVHFRQKPGASLAFLELCELLRSAAPLVEPAKFAYASYLSELTEQMTVEDHPVAEIYALLEEALAEIERGPATGGLLRGFEIQLLARAGFGPQLDHCNACHRALAGGDPVLLDGAHGTFYCARCRAAAGNATEVSGEATERLRELELLPLRACRERQLAPVAAETALLTGRLLELHLARPLQSLKLIEQLAAL